MKKLWGIDLGGTKIEGVVLSSAENPQVLSRQRISTQREKGYQHILQRIGEVVQIISREVGEQPSRIGIGTPGTLDPQNQTLKNCNSTVLNGKPFKKDLEQVLGIPVAMANDANCFALAETRMGVVPRVCPQAKVVFGVILGTGVGGGIVINNKILNGLQGIGGEWGHTFLDQSGGPCYCGDEGCVEMIISGPALERYYKKLSGVRLTLKDIMAQYDQGNEHATSTVNRLLEFFGKGLANVINIIDPDIVVLGGGVGNIDLLYTEGRKMVQKHIFNTRFDTPIHKPILGDSAGVFGAAYLVED